MFPTNNRGVTNCLKKVVKNSFFDKIAAKISNSLEKEFDYARTFNTYTMSEDKQITELLMAWGDGDENSLERLLPVVETELRRIAHRLMRRENANHTLQTTALVN
ncbi:hypothetical protein BH18ACI1_BH18ACI1_24370 [soil metagenome]